MVHLLLLSTKCIDSSPCVVVVTENNRILFDVGEGTQRLCVEHGVKLSKMNDVFVTRFSPECIGGLPGLCLTMAEVVKTEVTIHGPDKLTDFLQATHHFMKIALDKFKVPTSIGLSTTTHVCDEITIHTLRFSSSSALVCTHLCYVGETAVIKGKFDVAKAAQLKVPKGPLYGKLKNGQSITLPSGEIIEPHQVLGEAEAARYFAIVCDIKENEHLLLQSIQNSPMFVRFAAGGDLYDSLECIIHLSSKSIVHSSDYQSWLGSFKSTVTHISATDGDSSFIASTLHTHKLQRVCPSLFCTLPTSFPSPSAVSNINVMQGQPLLKVTLSPSHKRGIEPAIKVNISQEADQFIAEAHSLNSELANDINTANVIELIGIGATRSSFVDSKILTHYNFESSGASQLREHSDNRLLFLGTGCAVPSKYRNVSGILLQFASTNSSMLIDAGEGTWQQILKLGIASPKLFPCSQNLNISDENDRIGLHAASQLKLAWISHPHADHHLGLVSVILQRRELFTKYCPSLFTPLVVIAAPSILLFLRDCCGVFPGLQNDYVGVSSRQFDPLDKCEYSDSYFDTLNTVSSRPQVEDMDIDESIDSSSNERAVYTPLARKRKFELIEAESICRTRMNNALQSATDCFAAIGISNLINVPVTHCSQSYGLVLEGSAISNNGSKFKLVYSGDTRPCPTLVNWGQNATILIHESTFEDDKLSEAIPKRHSTVGEALDVGANMNAHRIILTHFSQRYPSMPIVDIPLSISTGLEFDAHYKRFVSREEVKFVVAFDYMILSFQDLLWAPAVIPALEKALPANDDNDEIEEVVGIKCVCTDGSCLGISVQGVQYCKSVKKTLKRKGGTD